MSTTFRTDPSFIADLPKRIQRRRARDGAITVIALVLAPYFHLYLLVALFIIAAAYWFYEFRRPGVPLEIDVMVESQGMILRHQGRSFAIPWNQMRLARVHRDRAGTVSRIDIVDRSLPPGARSFRLEGFCEMDLLLRAIEARVQSAA